MQPGTVYLVGAGPGHPGLLTLRAVECLQKADVVLYDKLAPLTALDHAPAAAEKTCVTDLGPDHRQRQQPGQEAMIAAALAGKQVVRLKGGDPCLFGRVGEEAQALHAAGIPFEIVPGVTAASGASAFAGIPLTHRTCASAVAFVTGHEDPAKPDSILDWPVLARFPGTLVFYMGVARLKDIARALIASGKDSATPAAVVRWASLGEQATVQSTLAELPQVVEATALTPPALVIIGRVVSLRDELAWFEQLPLFGKRVLVTRPHHQAGELAHGLVTLGASPVLLPAVEILEPENWNPVDQAIAGLSRFDWLVFTSVNGVRMFLDRLRSLGRDLRALGHLRLAAIGAKTAQALRAYHLDADVVPERFQSEDLAVALREQVQPHQRVLLARADRGRELLREELQKVCVVEQIAVYRQVDAIDANSTALEALRRGEIDFIALTSSNIARALLTSLDEPSGEHIASGRTKLVSISGITTAEINRLGYTVAAQAGEATNEGLQQALVELADMGLGAKP